MSCRIGRHIEGFQQLLRNLREDDAATLPPIVEKPWSDMHETWISPVFPAKLEALIRGPIERVELDRVPLDEAIEKLRNLSGANIWVQWKLLADAHVSRRRRFSENERRAVDLNVKLAFFPADQRRSARLHA